MESSTAQSKSDKNNAVPSVVPPIGGEKAVTARPTGLAEQARALREGEVSSRELVEEALARAEATQATLNAFRVICAEEALAAAEEADRHLGEGAVEPSDPGRGASRRGPSARPHERRG